MFFGGPAKKSAPEADLDSKAPVSSDRREERSMLDARPSLQPIRWTALSEPAEPLLVQPVERQGLANEPLKGQVDGLGAFEDGTLDLG